MTNRVAYAPQDFQKLCRQAERDHESRKLLVLMDRLKRQMAKQANSTQEVDSPKPPLSARSSDSVVLQLPVRSAPFER
jgi:hypothetical protein